MTGRFERLRMGEQPSPDPLRPAATDADYEAPAGQGCALVFIAYLVVVAVIVGMVVGRITA